jgi:uncharacterized membrane protein YgcG
VGGASVASAESVQSFVVEYKIHANGQVHATEEIVYDFGAHERHGIFRNLHKQHPQGASAWYKERFVDITVQSVARGGEPAPFTVTEDRREMEIRIGDSDRTMTGVHTYTINYALKGAFSTTERGNEFYWNVTGSEWDVPLQRVRATVVGADAGLLTESQACYQGRPGATTTCDIATSSVAKRVFTATDIAPDEELTIAVAATDAVVPQSTERWSTVWVLLAVFLVWLGGLCIWVWRYRTTHDPDQPVVPQYEPYNGYLPMYTGVLFNGRVDPHDITAGILYLAEQGFLQITRTEETVWWLFSTTDYELTLRRSVPDMPNQFLRDLSGLLFPNGTNVPQTERLSALKKRQSQNQKILRQLRQAVYHDLQDNGFTARHINWRQVTLALCTGAVIAGLLIYEGLPVIAMLVGLSLAGALAFLWAPRRTKQGYEALLHIKGFREFLRLTDSERFTFHNAPARNPQTFMEYLPYAIALGVEKEWAAVFADITIPQPEWYSDASQQSFSAAALTSDLQSFSSAFASSSGSSGSSGGGSAGGGAGGGGGGSW